MTRQADNGHELPMRHAMMDNEDEVTCVKIPRPSREEIESLCILHVAAPAGCSLGDLAVRLGLSRELARAMEEAIAPLVASGRLELREGVVALTAEGEEWRRSRFSELGLS